MERRSTFIRDLLVKILLIALFLFLLMYLFPMPNLTPFYSAIFNNNIQTMKDAAEDYYTVKNMPTEDGKSVKMTLKEMEEKKLIIPFVDKDGKSCNKSKSYVKVTKDGDEYVLKVSLTCSDESNYIVERIGCHNFCPSGVCDQEKTIAEVIPKEEKTVVCDTDEDGTITVKVPTGEYITEYEYKKVTDKSRWVTGEWRNTKVTENETTKLESTRTQYTGQKKVTANTTLYEQIAYGYNDKWTIGNWQDMKETETETRKLHDTRTLYTGQKKVVKTETEYKHVKYGYKENWTIGNWVNEKETETSTHKLYSSRNLYTGQKLETIKTTKYKHTKTKYTLEKKVETKSTTCSDWIKDTNWYSSKPASTSTKVYGDSYNSKSTTSWKLIQSSYKSYTVMPTYSVVDGVRYKYELVSKQENPNCGSNCSTNKYIYFYNVYKEVISYQYQYYYKTCTEKTSVTTDTKVVYKKADSDALIAKGYKLVSKVVEDTIWTTSSTAPTNYEYTGVSETNTEKKYISLGKWVLSKEALGEYTYNIQTAVQYKYADLTKTKYIIDTKWTKSKASEAGYEYTGETRTNSTTTYVDLGKWVTSKEDLGEYTYNIKTKTQYRYKTLTRTKYIKDTIWTTTNVAVKGYVLTGNKKTTTKTTYIDLGYYVNSKSELKEYTYNVTTRTQYRYKTLIKDTTTEYTWSTKKPGDEWIATGNSRKKWVQTGYKEETRSVRRNKQKY